MREAYLKATAPYVTASVLNWGERVYGESAPTLEAFLKEQLGLAFDAGQCAALERSGIQPALDILKIPCTQCGKEIEEDTAVYRCPYCNSLQHEKAKETNALLPAPS